MNRSYGCKVTEPRTGAYGLKILGLREKIRGGARTEVAGLLPELIAGGGGRAGRGLPEMGRGGRPESGRRRRPPVAAAARAAAAAARARGGAWQRRWGPAVARGGRRAAGRRARRRTEEAGGRARVGLGGPARASRAGGGRRRRADRWRPWSGWRWRRTLSGFARTRPERRIWDFFRVRGERIREFRMEGVYIGLEGARRVQMRCGFWPRDRDRTL